MTSEPKIDASIVGDLLSDGPDTWPVGVCEVVVYDRKLKVLGEGGHLVGIVEAEDYKTGSYLFDTGSEVIDIELVAKKVNELIEHEHAQL